MSSADAEAIREAASAQTMRFVPVKSEDRQSLQAVHRIRFRLVRDRTALVIDADTRFHARSPSPSSAAGKPLATHNTYDSEREIRRLMMDAREMAGQPTGP